MKHLTIISGYIGLLMLILTVISCSESGQESIAPDLKPTISLTEAKDWFDSFSNQNPRAKNQGAIAPRWDKATVFNNTVELPFTVDDKLQLPHSEFGLKQQGRKRIIVYKDEKGLYSSHTVSYIPSDKFKADIKTINKSNLRAKRFDGKIMVGPMNSNYLIVLSMEKGQITDHTKIIRDNKPKLSERIAQWWQQCTDWFQWGGSEWFYLDTTCETWYESDSYNTNAYNYGMQFDWFETYYGGGDNGSGGGTYNAAIAQQVNDRLLTEPFELLEIPCDQLPQWQTLAQNDAPQAIKDKINQLQTANSSLFDDWAIQTLNGANGTIVNMDYFSVNVNTLPNNPLTNQPFTPEDFLNYFRLNINNFVTGSTFSPYCEIASICDQETSLWNSTNPVGAIIYIDIPVDDGVVVCSEYNSSYWYFMTLEAPGAGNHPVSGTRQFGFESDGNGGYNFFIRGVDRFDSNIMENSAYMIGLGDPFLDADNLWKSFQTKLNNFINTNGGNSFIQPPTTYRPDWEKVDQVLKGNRPISDLGCN